jgi:hypothetical protein
MKFWFILRSDHEAQVDALLGTIKALEELKLALQAHIIEKGEEIAGLTEILTSPKCNDYTQKSPERPKGREISINTRSGWRTRAELAARATLPPPADSAQALERRVEAQREKQ